MKALVNIISHAIAFVLIPLLFIVYLFVLLLFTVAEIMFYVFDRTEQKKTQIISKLLFPLSKK